MDINVNFGEATDVYKRLEVVLGYRGFINCFCVCAIGSNYDTFDLERPAPNILETQGSVLGAFGARKELFLRQCFAATY